MKRIVVYLCLLGWAGMAMGQRTTRPGLRLGDGSYGVAVGDTVRDCTDSLRLSGYEKTLRSSYETLFATNLCAADTIKGVGLTIEYMDASGRQLHQRQVEAREVIPPGQTRQLRFASWDKQKVWYYERSAPARVSSGATPYQISVCVDYYLR
ncbi:MAG: hypothetical protein LUD17_07795 [Bacteroidales bacterium]|nr:hypothetical protein [Bacteroidales bacterium]